VRANDVYAQEKDSAKAVLSVLAGSLELEEYSAQHRQGRRMERDMHIRNNPTCLFLFKFQPSTFNKPDAK
jgi:hypothetical protein